VAEHSINIAAARPLATVRLLLLLLLSDRLRQYERTNWQRAEQSRTAPSRAEPSRAERRLFAFWRRATNNNGRCRRPVCDCPRTEHFILSGCRRRHNCVIAHCRQQQQQQL